MHELSGALLGSSHGNEPQETNKGEIEKAFLTIEQNMRMMEKLERFKYR